LRPSFANAIRNNVLASLIPSDLAGGGTGFHYDHARQIKGSGTPAGVWSSILRALRRGTR